MKEIMLYGNSSLGKTELVREIASKFFGGKYLEKHARTIKYKVQQVIEELLFQDVKDKLCDK